jgi:hypothetical protein
MTAPELIHLFLFADGFGAPLGDQFGDWVAALRRLAKPLPQSFERDKRGLQHKPAVLNSRIHDLTLLEPQLFSNLDGNHHAPLSTKPDLCH